MDLRVNEHKHCRVNNKTFEDKTNRTVKFNPTIQWN